MRKLIFCLPLLIVCCQVEQKKEVVKNEDKAVLVEPILESNKQKSKSNERALKKVKEPLKIKPKTKKILDYDSSADTMSFETKDYSVFHKEALAFCKENRFHKGYYFLLDYSLPSGKNRFFIYDFDKGKVVNAKLVTHGACDVFQPNYSMWDSAVFSDRINSHCSSKGKYKIGRRDYSGWGINIKYWIEGLESSNKSAEKRVVVLHSWGLVADEEIYPEYSPLSWGCPAVSNNFMYELDHRLKKTKKPVLLWIVD